MHPQLPCNFSVEVVISRYQKRKLTQTYQFNIASTDVRIENGPELRAWCPSRSSSKALGQYHPASGLSSSYGTRQRCGRYYFCWRILVSRDEIRVIVLRSNDSGCVLVTGVTAGIGRALAYAISDPPSKPRVIAAGRRQDRLDELASKMDTIQVNFDTDKETIKMFVDDTIAKYPDAYSMKLGSRNQKPLILIVNFTYNVIFYTHHHLFVVYRTFERAECQLYLHLDHYPLLPAPSIETSRMLRICCFDRIPTSDLQADGRPYFICPVTTGLVSLPCVL
ncbi:oxidoreductase DltE [Salix suchowensis]|nr:oxidoreductase DltE [Salix suchowensis]